MAGRISLVPEAIITQVEPLLFYRNLLRQPFSPVRERRALLLVTLLLVSQAANAAGFFWERLSYKV